MDKNLVKQGERVDDLQNGYFVIQDPEKFCFGMDAVLLSGFARVTEGEKVLDMGILDMMMFSINPAYDYRKGEYGIGNVEERMALYRRCEKEGIGISVMKAFGAGQLLNEKTSPFGKALTEYQCIQYALDKPGVVTVLPGIRGKEDLKRILG